MRDIHFLWPPSAPSTTSCLTAGEEAVNDCGFSPKRHDEEDNSLQNIVPECVVRPSVTSAPTSAGARRALEPSHTPGANDLLWTPRLERDLFRRRQAEFSMRYGDRYVALWRGEVVAVGDTPLEAAKAARERIGRKVSLFIHNPTEPL